MPTGDFIAIFNWWFWLFIIGILFFPFAARLFHNFSDRGYIFAKSIGMVVLSYGIFLVGMLHLFPFTRIVSISILLLIGVAIFLPELSIKNGTVRLKKRLFSIVSQSWPLLVLEEILFFLGLGFWAFVRAHQPDIQGLEKFMDFGFVNSLLRSTYFPPVDMWFPPLPINYYYFGHLITAVLTKLSGVAPQVSYNLMIAALFSFTFVGAFAIAINLLTYAKGKNSVISHRKILGGGFLAGFLTTLSGNLHTVYTFFSPYQNESPVPFWQLPFSLGTFPNFYWYPNATRFIYNTIHEFPLYSFVVSDLHGHVIDIPIVLTIIAILLHEFTQPFTLPMRKIVFVAFLVAISYMTNAWNGFIYLLLLCFVLLLARYMGYFDRFRFRNIVNVGFLTSIAVPLLICVAGFLVFSFPFSLHFKPFVSGIGVLCAPPFLTGMGKLGPFVFEVNHCQHSPLWQLALLWGFFYFFVVSFLLFFRTRMIKSDYFVLLLISIATLLLIIPELVYVKDIYPDHYRANTMFKLGYQAFIMLSIATAYIIIRIIAKLKVSYLPFVVLVCIGSIGLLLVMIYPYFATMSYYENFKNYRGLDGTQYLKRLYPSDYEAIGWINQNVHGQPVILEAQGDSYTDYGRVSANTGLPTVLGWTVHEWLWRGSYDIPSPRIADVEIMYESKDASETNELLQKYNVSYIFVGNLEKEKYTVSEEKFLQLGTIVSQKGDTKIYKITPFP